MKKTTYELDTLTELASISAGNSATALGKFIGKKIEILKPSITIATLENISNHTNLKNKKIRAIALKINHKISGIYVMTMTVEDSLKLAKKIITSQNSKMSNEISVLKELGNIMCGTALTALSNFLQLDISTSVPAITTDSADAIMSTLASQLGQKSEQILLFENTFGIDNISLSAYYLFDPSSTEKILDLTNYKY